MLSIWDNSSLGDTLAQKMQEFHIEFLQEELEKD